jgi:hypothetical protein
VAESFAGIAGIAAIVQHDIRATPGVVVSALTKLHSRQIEVNRCYLRKLEKREKTKLRTMLMMMQVTIGK